MNQVSVDNIEYLALAAPVETGSKEDHQKWINKGVPFFDDRIIAAWKLYCSPLNDDDTSQLSFVEERRERDIFIHSPQYIANLNHGVEQVVGTLWIDDISSLYQRRSDQANIHIRAHNDYRKIGVGSRLLKFFLERCPENYKIIQCVWPERAPQDDPTNIFKKFGFEITEQYGLQVARLELHR